MKKTILSILTGLILGTAAFAQNEIFVSVTNNLSIARQNETIALDWKELVRVDPALKPDLLLIRDVASGNPLVSQAIDADGDGTPEKVIFQVDFAAGERIKSIKIEPSKTAQTNVKIKTFGRFVPERMDDFAWENDRVAFRTYGKTLEKELVSSGIDVWAKRVDYPIIDQW
jgi:hypothetical protein